MLICTLLLATAVFPSKVEITNLVSTLARAEVFVLNGELLAAERALILACMRHCSDLLHLSIGQAGGNPT